MVFNTHHASVAHVALFLLLLLVMYNPWTVGPRGWVGEEGGSGVEVVKGKLGGGGGGLLFKLSCFQFLRSSAHERTSHGVQG